MKQFKIGRIFIQMGQVVSGTNLYITEIRPTKQLCNGMPTYSHGYGYLILKKKSKTIYYKNDL